MLLLILTLLSAAAFAYYGYGTLVMEAPRLEYQRFGMTHLRVFVGLMQLLGVAGLLVGLQFAIIGAMAATGFAIMMVAGLLVRYQSGDRPRLMIPAASLGILNTLLVVHHVL